ncbi:MAG: PilZ domain-containing protein [Desulfobacterales bacterium]|nr:PilZ domain-containing protein [Desulfobacterales bacterium]
MKQGIKKESGIFMGKEKRKETRLELIKSLRVLDRDTGQFVGLLLDITMQGMLLGSGEPLPMKEDFHFWIEIVTEKVVVDAHSMWGSKDEKRNFHKTGFRFVNLTKKTSMNIKSLIEVLKVGQEG